MPVRHIKHESELGRWEFAFREPAPLLRSFVEPYTAWTEDITSFSRRVEMPYGGLPMIVSFAGPLYLGAPGDDDRSPSPFRDFVAGNHDTYATSSAHGPQAGVQVDFRPLGARMLLGMPLHELTNQAVTVEDALGPDGRILAEKLRAAPTWDACFDLLDAFITARLATAQPVPEGIAWALARLRRNDPDTTIGGLADALGVSHRALIAMFRDYIGLTPRMVARVARFRRTVETIDRERPASLADLAVDCGYYDQSHLHRDFRQFAGMTPAEYVRRLAPDNGGLIGD
ncbi:MAG: helix-turn-helix domain-containing protein [Dehalococcoidia bacterium]|nr:helix-turn-helix domain-containing protein [Dehalococcoidia bacterium]